MARNYPNEKQSWGIWLKAYIICWSIFIGILAIIFAAIECPFDPIPYRLSQPPALVGHLTSNNRLPNADLLFENDILGPESFVFFNGVLYASLADGRIIQCDMVKRTFVTIWGGSCKRKAADHCGRPLGMRRDHWGHLIVVDSLNGMYTLYPKEKFIQPMIVMRDNRYHFFNDVDYLSDGTFVVSDSTDRFPANELIYEFLENKPNGRLWRYDPMTNTTSIFLSGLHFPNGVQSHSDKESVLIAESSRFRIVRYYFKGPRNGTLELFADNLPGIPDNIRPSKDGGFWVALDHVRYRSFFNFIDFTAMRPWLRSLIGKVFSVAQLHYLFAPNRCLLLKLDSDGRIVDSLHDPSGYRVTSCSQAVEADDQTLIIGSVAKPYIARLRL